MTFATNVMFVTSGKKDMIFWTEKSHNHVQLEVTKITTNVMNSNENKL
jgi:hypothetical protein